MVRRAEFDTGLAQEALRYFLDKGYSSEQASGIVSNLIAESGLDHQIKGDSGKAHGIAQWHPDRRGIFERVFGKPFSESSFKDQLDFVDWELNNTEKRAGDVLRAARDPAEAAAAVERHYERPAGSNRPEGSESLPKRMSIAQQLTSLFGGQSTPAPVPAAPAPSASEPTSMADLPPMYTPPSEEPVMQEAPVQAAPQPVSRLDKYAEWLLANKDKKGTPEFDTVANAYKALRTGGEGTGEKPQGGFFSSALESAKTALALPEAARFALGESPETREAFLKSQESKYAQTSLSDVKDVGSFVDWLKQTGGATAGYLAAPGAAATAARIFSKIPGLPGAIGYGVLGAQYLTGALGRQAETQQEAIEKGEPYKKVDLPRAIVAAAGETALDAVGMEFFAPAFKRFPFVKNLLGEAGEKTAKETEKSLIEAFESGNLKIRNGVARGVAQGVAFEVPQEIAQQALERWQAGLSLTDEDARKEYFEAGAAATIFGGGLGGVSEAFNTSAKRRQAEDIIRARAAEKIKQEEKTTEEAPTKPVVAEGDLGEMLKGVEPVSETPPTGPAITEPTKKAAKTLPWADLTGDVLEEWKTKALNAGIAPETLEEFLTRNQEIDAARGDPQANKFKLNNQIQKNTGLFNRIQKAIAEAGKEPAAPPSFKAEPKAPAEKLPPVYQRPPGASPVPAPKTFAPDAGRIPIPPVPRKTRGAIDGEPSATESEPGRVQPSDGVPVQGEPTGGETGAPPAEGLDTGEPPTERPTDGEGVPPAPLVDAKTTNSEYNKLIRNLDDIARTFEPEEVSIEETERARRQTPVTKKELNAIPADADAILKLADQAVKEKKLAPFNYNRIANAVKTARVRPGFDPKTDLTAAREMLAKLIRPLKKLKAEGGPREEIDKLKEALEEARKLELSDNPAQREKGLAIRKRAIDLLNRDRTPEKQLPEPKLHNIEPEKVAPKKAEPKKEAPKKEAAPEKEPVRNKLDPVQIEQDIKGKTLLEVADYLVENAPNAAMREIATRVRDTLKQYARSGMRLSFAVSNNKKDLGVTKKRNVHGVNKYTPDYGISKVYVAGVNLTKRMTPAYRAPTFGTSYTIILHELVHAATTPAVYETFKPGTREYKLQRDLDSLYDTVKRHFDVRKAAGAADHPIEQAATQGFNALEDKYELLSWALSDARMQDYLETIPYKGQQSVWSKFVTAIREYLGLSAKSDTALSELLRVSGELMDAGTVKATMEQVNQRKLLYGLNPIRQSATSRETIVNNMAKQAEPHAPKTPEEIQAKLAEQMKEKTGGNAGIKDAVKKAVTYKNTEEAIRLFQSDRRPLKRMQDALEIAGKLLIGENNFNNLYDLIVLSSGRAYHLMMRDIQPYMLNMQKAINDYAKATNLDTYSALARLHMYVMAEHEPERRAVKYIKNVPLDNKTKIKFAGKEMTPADARQVILDMLAKPNNLVDNGAAVQLRKILDDIVARYKTEGGFSPVGTKTIDINALDYNVIGGYSKEEIDAIRRQYREDPHQDIMKGLIENMKAVQARSLQLDKDANYWSQPTSNVAAFYGYKNYVPFKGKKDSKVTKDDETLDLNHDKVGGYEFTEFAYTAEGRMSDSDNPIMQVLVDGAKAATRAGRVGTSQAIKNLIEQRHIRGKLYKKITFEQRFNGFDPIKEGVQGSNMFFHYTPDGTIEVYEIFDTDKAISESIRRTFRKATPVLDKINAWTSGVGGLHTRYNVAFHPYNFVRDVLTNTWAVGAERGAGAAYRFISAAARQVADNGFYKAGKVSKLYAEGRVAEIEKLAATDESIRNVYEYLQEGGRVSYVMGLAQRSQIEGVLKGVGRSPLGQKYDSFQKWVDVWTDSFEFTSRAAAYGVMKGEYVNDYTKDFEKRNGRKPNAAELKDIDKKARQRAASYAKELANFELVGKYGKQAGAAFMFFRPAATGAVRALDALRPAFESLEMALSHLPAEVRNDPEAVKAFKENYAKRKELATTAVLGLFAAGAMLYAMARLAAENDDEDRNRVAIDDKDMWTRNLRLPIHFLNPILGKDNDFLNIPWGFGGGAFAAAGAQMMAVANGDQSLANATANTVSIALDSFLPIPFARFNPTDNPGAWVVDSVLPSLARPLVEYQMNYDTFGKQIYNARESKYGDAFSGGEYVPEIYKQATRFLAEATNGGINWQPQTLYFFANNYIDGLSRVGHNMWGLGHTLIGNKDFDAKRDLTVFDSFIGKKSSVDMREYAEIEKKVKEIRDTYNMFKNRPDGGKSLSDYVEANPEAPVIVDYYNKMNNGPLRDVRERLNTFRGSDLTPAERRMMMEQDTKLRDMYAHNFVEFMKNFGIEP